MSNLIVIAVLLVVVVWAVKESMHHMRGEGGCCGGGSCEHSVKVEKKLSGPIVHSYDFEIEGMHCENCAAKVTRAINAIDGAAAEVSLATKRAHVECDREIAPATIIAAVTKKGYAVKQLV